MNHHELLASLAFSDALPIGLAFVLAVCVALQQHRIWKLDRELEAMHAGVAAMAEERRVLEQLRRDVRIETARLDQARVAARAVSAIQRRPCS